jgi:hypothetical protein
MMRRDLNTLVTKNNRSMFYFIKASYVIYKAIKFSHKATFSKRRIFWDEFRPKLGDGCVACYPDALMMVKMEDYNRAIAKARGES